MPDNLYFYKGRVALYALLKAMGLNAGDEVILSGFTCVVVPNAISYLGGKPVYVDIDPDTYNIDPRKIDRSVTGRTRAIIAQHTFGIPAEMDKVLEIAGRYNLYVIEDSCHAIGSGYKGREVGTFGDAAFFSSQWSKPVTTGLGGWTRVNNPELWKTLNGLYRSFSRPSAKDDMFLRLQYYLHSVLLTPSLFWSARDAYRLLSRYGLAVGSSTNDELECRMPLDYERKMTEWQKRTVVKKLAGVRAVTEHRRWAAARYEKLLPSAGIEPVRLGKDYDTVFLRYPVRVKDKKMALAAARSSRIEIGDWFLSPVHPNLSGWEKISYEKGMCPNAETACDSVINLPTHQRIGNKEIERIIDFIGKSGGIF